MIIWDPRQIFNALKALIVRENLDAVNCIEDLFQLLLCEVVQDPVEHETVRFSTEPSPGTVDIIVGLSSEQLITVFIRYFLPWRQLKNGHFPFCN